MEVAAPLFLFGLFGLAVPILIHLWSKKTPKTVLIGSIRFLQQSDSQTIKTLRPTDKRLLMLRLLIVTALSLLLAKPFIWEEKAPGTAYLIDPQYQAHSSIKTLLDTLPATDTARWLLPGFPLVNDSIGGQKFTTDYWQLLSDMKQIPASAYQVYSPLYLRDFKGKKQSLPTGITFFQLPEETRQPAFSEIIQKGNQAFRLKVASEENQTNYQWEPLESTGKALEIGICIQADSAYSEEERILKTAISVLNENSLLTIKLLENPDSDEWMVWLSDKPTPKRKKLLLADRFNQQLIEKKGGQVYGIKPGFSAEVALKEQLPLLLEQMLSAEFEAEAADQRSMPISELEQLSGEEKSSSVKHASSYENLFWLLLVLLIAAERLITLKRK